MKMNKKAFALSLAAVVACGTLAGCDLITTDSEKDMLQVVAEVDISKGADFAEGKQYAEYADIIQPSSVLKREMVANFLSSGYQYVQNGTSYAETFDLIKESLVNRKMLIQYAKVYLFENAEYTAQGYENAVAEAENKELAGLRYFLTEEEQALAEYQLKVMVNNTIDSQEKSIITAEEDVNDVSVRTTPTGIDTKNEDYYDAAYKIYTGKNSASDCGSYETVDGSTPTTRKKAYNSFLSNLLANNLLAEGEDVSKFENLNYYEIELQTAFEDALLQKLAEAYEEKAESTLTEAYVQGKYAQTLATQKETFANKSTFETALDGISDTSFVLTAPHTEYGFVINILLPFSKTQSNYLAMDNGNEWQKFETRASVLKNVKATDQRESWFTGSVDYSYEAAENEAYEGRSHLFFEDSIKATENSAYEAVKNYYGKYAYNGTVSYDEEEKEYTLTPNKIDIDGFIGEMEGYLRSAGLTVASGTPTVGYYDEHDEDYYYTTDANGNKVVDYSKFLYYQGNVVFDTFNANEVFVAGTDVNKAMSVVNELSFAYNTDTAGLNTYLGYAVSAYDTSFVSEFEYAAKAAVLGGVGTYTVAPSTYGWHIMYCTFTYANADPYTFDYSDIDREGSFSNLYYEALKASTVEGYSSAMQTQIVNNYVSCVTVYEEAYADLKDLDNRV